MVDEKEVGSITKKVPFLKWPFVRGTVVLIESLVMGIEALSFSASQAADEEEEQLTAKEIIITIILSLGLAILLFAVLPTAAAHLLIKFAPGTFIQNLIEGFFRIAVLVIYVGAIGRLPDIKRVFQYHGAEHKVINAYEAGDGCGGEGSALLNHAPQVRHQFFLIVIVISILIFSLLGKQVCGGGSSPGCSCCRWWLEFPMNWLNYPVSTPPPRCAAY